MFDAGRSFDVGEAAFMMMHDAFELAAGPVTLCESNPRATNGCVVFFFLFSPRA